MKEGTFVGEMKKRITEKMFRMIIFGQTASGKTYFLANSVLPAISKNFDKFVVFTKKYNSEVYRKMLKKVGVEEKDIIIFNVSLLSDPEDTTIIKQDYVIPTLQSIAKTQERNVLPDLDKEGHPTYKYRVLCILDDILNEKMMKSSAFEDVFYTYRHLNISVILLSQISNKCISTQMKGNTHYNVIFKMQGHYQTLYPRQLIADSLITRKGMEQKKAEEMASKIYSKYIAGTKFGWIMIDHEMNME